MFPVSRMFQRALTNYLLVWCRPDGVYLPVEWFVVVGWEKTIVRMCVSGIYMTQAVFMPFVMQYCYTEPRCRGLAYLDGLLTDSWLSLFAILGQHAPMRDGMQFTGKLNVQELAQFVMSLHLVEMCKLSAGLLSFLFSFFCACSLMDWTWSWFFHVNDGDGLHWKGIFNLVGAACQKKIWLKWKAKSMKFCQMLAIESPLIMGIAWLLIVGERCGKIIFVFLLATQSLLNCHHTTWPKVVSPLGI